MPLFKFNKIRDLMMDSIQNPISKNWQFPKRESFVHSMKKKRFNTCTPIAHRVGLDKPLLGVKKHGLNDINWKDSVTVFTWDFKQQVINMLSNPFLYGD